MKEVQIKAEAKSIKKGAMFLIKSALGHGHHIELIVLVLLLAPQAHGQSQVCKSNDEALAIIDSTDLLDEGRLSEGQSDAGLIRGKAVQCSVSAGSISGRKGHHRPRVGTQNERGTECRREDQTFGWESGRRE